MALALTTALAGCASLGTTGLIAPATAAAASGASPGGAASSGSTATASPATSAASATTAPAPAPTSAPTSSTTAAASASSLAAFTAEVTALDQAHSSTLAVAALDLTTGACVAYGTGNAFYTASIVKVDLVEAMLLRAQDKGRGVTTTEAAWARAAITVSDNEAASDIFASLGRAAGLTAYNVRLGLVSTVVSSAWGLTRTSAADQLQLLKNLTTASVLDEASRTALRSLMSQVAADQRWGVPVAGDGAAVVKNGWLAYSGDGGRWIVNSVGVVTSGGHTVLVAVLTRKGASEADGIAEVQQAARLAVDALTG